MANLFSQGYLLIEDGRVYMKKDSEKLYFYLMYVSDWSMWRSTMDGWLFYQKNPSSQEFFRIRFNAGKDMKLQFKGGEQRMSSMYWPTRNDVQVRVHLDGSP